jgi:ankyrin repeat protein
MAWHFRPQIPYRYGSLHETVVRLLLDNGANIEAMDEDCRTPLSLVLESGHKAVGRLLLDKGINIEARYEGKLRRRNPAKSKNVNKGR